MEFNSLYQSHASDKAVYPETHSGYFLSVGASNYCGCSFSWLLTMIKSHKCRSTRQYYCTSVLYFHEHKSDSNGKSNYYVVTVLLLCYNSLCCQRDFFHPCIDMGFGSDI